MGMGIRALSVKNTGTGEILATYRVVSLPEPASRPIHTVNMTSSQRLQVSTKAGNANRVMPDLVSS